MSLTNTSSLTLALTILPSSQDSLGRLHERVDTTGAGAPRSMVWSEFAGMEATALDTHPGREREVIRPVWEVARSAEL